MKPSTSEIEKALVAIRDEKSFTRKDVSHARLNRWNREVTIRRELLNIRPNIIGFLKERDLIEKTSESCKLTPYGLYLLKEFEEKSKEFGKSNVELIPAKVGDIITYKVRINPRAEPKIKTSAIAAQTTRITPEPPLVTHKSSEEYNQRKESIIKSLLELRGVDRPIKDIKEREKSLIIETRIPYHRTTEERKRLDEIAKEFGTEIITKDEPWDRNYIFIRGKQPIAVVVSRKKVQKGFRSYEPLEIRVDLTQYEKSAGTEKLISYLIEEFS